MGNQDHQPATRFRIDPSRIVHETIDDEAIVIDLETGTYFSLTGSGAEIWRLLVESWSPPEIADAFPGADAAAVEEIARGLLDAGVLVVDEAVIRQPAAAPSAAWTPPALQTYTDMEYFLLLDPVHDAPAAGWPHAKVDTAAGDIELVD